MDEVFEYWHDGEERSRREREAFEKRKEEVAEFIELSRDIGNEKPELWELSRQVIIHANSFVHTGSEEVLTAMKLAVAALVGAWKPRRSKVEQAGRKGKTGPKGPKLSKDEIDALELMNSGKTSFEVDSIMLGRKKPAVTGVGDEKKAWKVGDANLVKRAEAARKRRVLNQTSHESNSSQE